MDSTPNAVKKPSRGVATSRQGPGGRALRVLERIAGGWAAIRQQSAVERLVRDRVNANDDLQPPRLDTRCTLSYRFDIPSSRDPLPQGWSLPGTPLLTLTGPRLSVCRRGNMRTIRAVENGRGLRVPECQDISLGKLVEPVGITGVTIREAVNAAPHRL